MVEPAFSRARSALWNKTDRWLCLAQIGAASDGCLQAPDSQSSWVKIGNVAGALRVSARIDAGDSPELYYAVEALRRCYLSSQAMHHQLSEMARKE